MSVPLASSGSQPLRKPSSPAASPQRPAGADGGWHTPAANSRLYAPAETALSLHTAAADRYDRYLSLPRPEELLALGDLQHLPTLSPLLISLRLTALPQRPLQSCRTCCGLWPISSGFVWGRPLVGRGTMPAVTLPARHRAGAQVPAKPAMPPGGVLQHKPQPFRRQVLGLAPQ